ncbi:MAG: hypothetical protein ACP5PT_06830 [Brevinematia bacterium]
MENVFSNYIKELDEEHKKILEEIQKIREEKKLIKKEPEVRETLLKKLYALQSAPEENFKEIIELQKEIEKYRDQTQIKPVLEELDRKEKELFDKFIETPFEVEPYEIVPYINYQLPNGCWLEKPLNEKGEPTGEYLYKTDLGRMGTPNFKIICNEHGIPIEMLWLIQNESTYGYPLRFKRKLIVKNPIIEKLKPNIVEKEVTQEKIKPIDKIVELPIRCLCGQNLEDKLRMTFCNNCARDLFTIMKEIKKKNKVSQIGQQNKKKRVF